MRWVLFDHVDDDQARELLAMARRRRFARNETVFHEGDPGDSLHLIDRGHVAVRVTTPAGDVATLRILRDGQHFGDLVVVSQPNTRRSATITALERCETLELSGSVVADFAHRHRAFERAMARVVAQHLRVQSQLLLEALYLPAPRRLARRLNDLVDLYDGADIPLTQDDLAGLTGTTRQTVNQMLTEWRDAGVVELGRSMVRVVDRERLIRAAR